MKKILYINTETSPYVAESALATMGKAVPEMAQSNGCEIRTFMPKWGNINERRGQLHEMQRLSGMNIIINGTDHPLIIKVASIPVSRVQVYFIDNEDYFTHRGLECDSNGELYPDNGERAIFFARGVLETVKKLRWAPDVIVCNGWISHVLPLYLKKAYKDDPIFSNSKVVLSLFEDTPAEFGEELKDKIRYAGIGNEDLEVLSESTGINLAKLAANYSDAIVFGSDNIPQELMDYCNGLGLPVLPYNAAAMEDGSYIEDYNNFYDQL